MKTPSFLVGSILALAVASCGGGGGGGGGNNGPFSVVRVELPGKDPLNIVVGDDVRFVLAGYEVGTGRRVILQATAWSVLDNQSVGTIDQSGNFHANAAGSARIAAQWDGVPTAQPLKVTVRPQGLARIAGHVRKIAGNAPVEGVQVIFYNVGNAEVGRATSLADGSFLAQVPVSAVKMNFDEDTLRGRYLLQWTYRDVTYQAGDLIANCNAVFVLSNPPLTQGQTGNIPDPLLLYLPDAPPPFPDGCK